MPGTCAFWCVQASIVFPGFLCQFGRGADSFADSSGDF